MCIRDSNQMFQRDDLLLLMIDSLFIRRLQRFYIRLIFQLTFESAILLEQSVTLDKKCLYEESLSLINSSIMAINYDVNIAIFRELYNFIRLLFISFFHADSIFFYEYNYSCRYLVPSALNPARLFCKYEFVHQKRVV